MTELPNTSNSAGSRSLFPVPWTETGLSPPGPPGTKIKRPLGSHEAPEGVGVFEVRQQNGFWGIVVVLSLRRTIP